MGNMTAEARRTGIFSRVLATRTSPRGFCYEIWRDDGSGCRMEMETSFHYPTAIAAQVACNDATTAYIKKRRY
jgi:hypothetical protein